ncbi:hypothetical protein [Pseudarthrobacter sp. AB1]|uniref:hypothetical protein n=1 Tax=Pseudarthrobacter sp. AB1 TaxID=2138309 RepID=UPI00186BAD7C|nr:hypothetical protein [Pseudarthrobacter sp. AB1]
MGQNRTPAPPGVEVYGHTQDNFYADLPGAFALVPHQPAGPRVGDMLAGGGTKILSEGWVLLQPGFCKYDARDPVP